MSTLLQKYQSHRLLTQNITDYGLKAKESGYQDYSEEYDVSTALGYVLAAGISGNKLILEVTYMSLGEHKISGTWKEAGTSGDLPTAKKSMGLIAVQVGRKVW